MWQHVFHVVVCVLRAVRRAVARRTALSTHTCMQAQCKLPEDDPSGPKHVGANIRYFNVNLNILYVQ